MKNRFLTFVLVASSSGTAFAGQALRAPEAAAPAGAAAPAPEAAKAPVTPNAQGAPQAAAFAGTDESIYVVQKRAYSKSGKFELTPSFFTSLNNKFVGHLGLGLSAAYHLRENLGIEFTTTVPYVFYSFYSGLVYEVRQINLTPEVVDLKQMRYFNSLSLQFSALYGKLDFQGYLIDYDFYATAGTGLVKTVETCIPRKNGCGEDVGIGYGLKDPDDGADGWKISGTLGGGMRVFFSDRLGLRLEVRDLVYADRASEANVVTSDIRNNVIMFIGASALL